MKLEAKRLSVGSSLELIPPEKVDANAQYALVESNREYLRRWLPWVDASRSVSDSEQYLSVSQTLMAAQKALVFGVVVDGELGGMLGSDEIDLGNRSMTIGYWLAEPLQGRGIVTRCMKTFIALCFETLPLNRIALSTAPGNERSQRVAARLGFRREGVLRQAEWVNDHFEDSVVFGLLREEWQRSP